MTDHSNRRRPIKDVLTKVGLDPHDWGIKLLMKRLEEADMEVVYTGPWQSKAAVVSAVVQEDPDVVGFNRYSSDHHLVPKVLADLDDHGAVSDTLILAGGNIPDEDRATFEAAGVDEIFRRDIGPTEVINYIRSRVDRAGL